MKGVAARSSGSDDFGYDFGRVVHPETLVADHAHLWYGARSLLEHLFSPAEWLRIVPAGRSSSA